jgi:hypothetical protein
MSRLLSQVEYKQMTSYKIYAKNHTQLQTSMKLKLLNSVEEAFGERYWRLKDGTRKAIEFMCQSGAKRGFLNAKDHHLAKRYRISDKTIRNVLKILREAEIILTVYRRAKTQNGRSAPIHLFIHHPYFSHWEELLGLSGFEREDEKD